MQNIPTPTLLAVATGVTGAIWASGMIASLSIIGCPAALDLPSQAQTSAWKGLYDYGVAIMPKVAGTVALAYLYAAYAPKEVQMDGQDRTGYVVAAGLAVAIIPYTIILMRPTNNELFAAESGSGSKAYGTADVAALVNRWANLNLGRSLLPLASGILGMLTFFRTLS